MNRQIEKLIADVSRETYETVARGVLDDPLATLVGTPKWEPVGGRHADLQTVAVLKCTGKAISAGSEKSWSAVTKHIDLTVEKNPGSMWVDPMNEIALFRDGTFANSEVPFRVARCYGIDEPNPGRFSVWLEDLSNATLPPWSADEYERASSYLGQFQGKILAEKTHLPYVERKDIFKNRWVGWHFPRVMKVLLEQRDHPEIKSAFSGGLLDLTVELIQSFPALTEKVGNVETVLSHGDCHARNLFLTDEDLVAVDWSGISYEPLGSDFGQMVGAGLSWAIDERIEVAEAAPRLFDAYIEGLSASGWDGDERTIRLGMAAQFSAHLIIGASMPARVIDDPNMAARIEGRAKIPREEISSATVTFLEFAEPFMREAIEMANGK